MFKNNTHCVRTYTKEKTHQFIEKGLMVGGQETWEGEIGIKRKGRREEIRKEKGKRKLPLLADPISLLCFGRTPPVI